MILGSTDVTLESSEEIEISSDMRVWDWGWGCLEGDLKRWPPSLWRRCASPRQVLVNREISGAVDTVDPQSIQVA